MCSTVTRGLTQTALHRDAFIQYIDGLYGYAVSIARNRSDAEDLVQETFVRALSAEEGLRTDSNVKSWLFTILRNTWLNQVRKQRGKVSFIGGDSDDFLENIPAKDARDPYHLFVAKSDQNRVRQAIQQLPIEAREIILLREFEELSYEDIAGVLNCPIGTVMSRLARARSKLRLLLSELESTA